MSALPTHSLGHRITSPGTRQPGTHPNATPHCQGTHPYSLTLTCAQERPLVQFERTAIVGFVSDLPPPPPDPDSLDQRHHDPGHGHHDPVPEHSRVDHAAPEPGSRTTLEVMATGGLGCAASSPVLFVLVWFGIPYELSVAALFMGLGLSAASLMGFKRLGSRYRVRAVVGLSVAAFIFPFFLMVDYALGYNDFSCSGSLFWSCR